MAKWTVNLDNLSQGGFAPQYWREDYPRYGNSNMAGDMSSMDLTREGYIQPGPAVVVYPGGAAAITTTVRGFTQDSTNATTAYGVGGDKFYTLAASASLSHTISGAAVTIEAHDVAGYNSLYYYSWSTSAMGNVGRLSGSTYDDTWWTGTLSATALQTVSKEQPPRPIEVGNNDVMYIGNGRYIASYDGTTAQDKALDLPQNYEVQDLQWLGDRLYLPTLYKQYGTPNSSIFIWDGTTDSWEAEIPIAGTAGANYQLNGAYYQFYSDKSDVVHFAALDGGQLVDLTTYSGSTPKHYQVTDYNNYIVWIPGTASDDVYMYGPMNGGVPRLFHYADVGSTSSGGISNVLQSKGLIAANNDQLWYLDTYATPTYETASTWKSLLFDITGDRQNGGQVNAIRFNFEKLTSGAVLDWSLVNNQGVTIYSDTISYAKATASNPLHTLTSAFYPLNGKVTENFRVELNYANGSTTAPVRVMNIKCYGEG